MVAPLKNSCLKILFLFLPFISDGQTNHVSLVKDSVKWQLLLNDDPYYVKGAGGETDLNLLTEIGGNTIRTWGVENADNVLESAKLHGVKVMLGLWVQHERHGFDYDDTTKVSHQLQNFRKVIQKYKDHPALLMWCVGNEYELNYSNKKVWKAVNDIAKMIHEEDPNHPTVTVTAGTNPEKLNHVINELTEVDIYGINTYGDIGNVHSTLQKGGFDKPYMITEWGPTGHWEINKTKWGASIEQTSSEKFDVYRKRYHDYIESNPDQCIGSFAFLWGHKQEHTSTWYGLFSEQGMPTEVIDALEFSWKGEYPDNRSPSIDSVYFQNQLLKKDLLLKPNHKYTFEVFCNDLNNDKLTYKWELYPESTDLKSGGDKESKPDIIWGKIKGGKNKNITLKAPTDEGAYRLFLFVDDGVKQAYMNVPFYVEYLNIKKLKFKELEIEKVEL